MSQEQKTFDKDAIVSVLLKYLHPSQLVWAVFPNRHDKQRLFGCVVVGQEPRKIRKKVQPAILVRHERFKTNGQFQELYAVPRWFQLEGPASEETPVSSETSSDLETIVEEEEVHQEMPPVILQHANTGAPFDVDEIIGLPGVEVDDDCMPAPENTPTGK